ncbi:hypothetical protein ACSF3O_03150 [Acinetobacter soli]|uniref:hypothetical protein n=1 Tax=Acinetobacter soli TaxID=487316 RepID=UPI00258C66B5|nr:hypothetical protein [uncultured Acinetobacter sp.]
MEVKKIFIYLSFFLVYPMVYYYIKTDLKIKDKITIVLFYFILGAAISYEPINTINYWLLPIMYSAMAFLAIKIKK